MPRSKPRKGKVAKASESSALTNSIDETITETTKGRRVLLDASIISIRNINTIEETFEIALRIFLFWAMVEDDSWDPELGVSVVLSNRIGDIQILDKSPIEKKHGIYNSKNWYIRATMEANFDLHQFPFDRQLVEIVFRIPRVEDQGISEVVAANFEDTSQRWKTSDFHLHEFDILNISQSVIHMAPGKQNFKPEFRVEIHLQRHSHFYMVNIALQHSLLVLLCFSVYCVEASDVASRMSIVLAILLTSVAFKLSVVNLLPKLQYDTLLDKLTLSLVAIVYLIGFEVAFITRVASPARSSVDAHAAHALFSIYVGIHVFFVVYVSVPNGELTPPAKQ